jgi:hypothetical protein
VELEESTPPSDLGCSSFSLRCRSASSWSCLCVMICTVVQREVVGSMVCVSYCHCVPRTVYAMCSIVNLTFLNSSKSSAFSSIRVGGRLNAIFAVILEKVGGCVVPCSFASFLWHWGASSFCLPFCRNYDAMCAPFALSAPTLGDEVIQPFAPLNLFVTLSWKPLTILGVLKNC